MSGDLPGGMTQSPGWDGPDEDCIVGEMNDDECLGMLDGMTEDGEIACSAHDGWLPCGHGHYHAPDAECERCEGDDEESEGADGNA